MKKKTIKCKHEYNPSIFWFGLLKCDRCQKHFTQRLTYPDFVFAEVKIKLPNN